MSEVKLLNLDELAVVKRVVRLFGEEYPVAEQTVGQMVERLELAKAFEKMDQAEQTIAILQTTAKHILPTAPEEVIQRMTPQMISRIVEFVSTADLPEEVEKAVIEARANAEKAEPGQEKK